MKKLTILRLIAMICALTVLMSAAVAETALVVTENKGKLNLRKSPTTDSKRIAQIPNLSTIEILDVEGDWAKATYNDKTGFVMTKFLRMASQLAGKTVFADDYGTVMLRSEADKAAPVAMLADNLAGVTVDSVENGWAAVKLSDGTTLYADAAQFTHQVTEKPATIHWIAETGTIEQDCTLKLIDGSTASLPADSDVTVTELTGDGACLIVSEAGCGYVPASAVHLYGPEDTGAETGSVSRATAEQRAKEALRKKFKGVSNELLIPAIAVYRNVYGEEMPYYHCGFFNSDGEYAYGVLVNAANAKAVYTARYDAFATAQAVAPETEPETVPGNPPETLPEAVPVDVTETVPETVPDAVPIEPETESKADDEKKESPEIIVVTMDGGEKEKPDTGKKTELLTMEPLDAEETQTPVPEQAVEAADAKEPAAAAEPAAAEPVEAAPPAEGAAPAGEVELGYTGDIELGEVEYIEVAAWTDYQCIYQISKGGEAVADCGAVNRFNAAFRPREAGQYQIKVTVLDENGGSASVEAEFAVAEAEVEGVLFDQYSQKDGWWKDKTYNIGTLQESGAPIFTLTNALSRIGLDSVDILPEELANNGEVAACITEKGLDNAALIQAASKIFGFKTQKEPLKDAAKIGELLKKGAVFSFTNENGNVVLAAGISDDGTMVQIIDPMPGASFDPFPQDAVFRQEEDGSFTAMQSLDDDPYIFWYFETLDYGSSEYWMKLDAVAPQGLLLIQPADKK